MFEFFNRRSAAWWQNCLIGLFAAWMSILVIYLWLPPNPTTELQIIHFDLNETVLVGSENGQVNQNITSHIYLNGFQVRSNWKIFKRNGGLRTLWEEGQFDSELSMPNAYATFTMNCSSRVTANNVSFNIPWIVLNEETNTKCKQMGLMFFLISVLSWTVLFSLVLILIVSIFVIWMFCVLPTSQLLSSTVFGMLRSSHQMAVGLMLFSLAVSSVCGDGSSVCGDGSIFSILWVCFGALLDLCGYFVQKHVESMTRPAAAAHAHPSLELLIQNS